MNRHFLVCSLPIGSKQFYRFVRQVMLNRLRIEFGRCRYSITTQLDQLRKLAGTLHAGGNHERRESVSSEHGLNLPHKPNPDPPARSTRLT